MRLANFFSRLGGLPVAQLRALTLVGVLICVWLVFNVLTNGLFLSPRNLTTLTIQVAITAILAVGIVMVMVPGHIDLSIGSAVAFTGVFAAMLVDPNRGWDFTQNPVVICGLTIGVGLLIGVWQGFWVAWMGVPAFIVTLASLLALRGAALTITGGSTVTHNDLLSFLAADYISGTWTAIAMTVVVVGYSVTKYFDWRARSRIADPDRPLSFFAAAGLPVLLVGFLSIAVTAIAFSYRGTPVSVVILGIVIAIVTFLMLRTVFGRRLYAIGGNPSAARYAGIKTKWNVFAAFVLMGSLYAVAGLILDGRVGVAVPNAGIALELAVIASAVIGGTSLFGGVGVPVGAVIGALLLESLNNGMGLMNIDTNYQMIANGLVLLVAVYLDKRGRAAGG
jgi:ABC-type xylose transport system permease subunit